MSVLFVGWETVPYRNRDLADVPKYDARQGCVGQGENRHGDQFLHCVSHPVSPLHPERKAESTSLVGTWAKRQTNFDLYGSSSASDMEHVTHEGADKVSRLASVFLLKACLSHPTLLLVCTVTSYECAVHQKFFIHQEYVMHETCCYGKLGKELK